MPFSVIDRSVFPWSSLVKLELNRDQGLSVGTAFPVDRRTLVTAGHLLRDGQFPEVPANQNIFAYIGPNELVFHPSEVRIASEWSAPLWPKAYDYGVLRFNSDLPLAPIEVFSMGPVNSVGVLLGGLRIMDLEWVSNQGTAKILPDRSINYSFETAEGMSGGPVLLQNGTTWKAIGLHQAALPINNLGLAWSVEQLAGFLSLPVA